MLTELHIEHLGVIDRLNLVMAPGLTVLTGETGAGKTMLVEAIELLTGARADPAVVRAGCAEARVDGRFTTADGSELVLTRVVSVEGRSRAYLDGRPVTIATLADRVGPLVDLHGQHAHQSLLRTSAQRAILDQIAGIDPQPLASARAQVGELDTQLAVFGGDEQSRARERDLLQYQAAELDEAALSDPAEVEHLTAEEEILADATGHREAAAAALAQLDDGGGARDAIAGIARELGDRAPFRALASRFAGITAELDDLRHELRIAHDEIAEHPERLQQVRERHQRLRELCRKYGPELSDVIAFHRSVRDRLCELDHHDERAQELMAARADLIAERDRIARELGDQRRSAAPRVAAEVTAVLQTLAMPHAELSVAVLDPETDLAAERIEFQLAANPGSPPAPLGKVASGGELARVMIAVRLVALSGARRNPKPDLDPTPVETLVFDEVDAGIGGAAAGAVAEALAGLATRHQVLVVTHLAQVAAYADQQVVVTKRVDGHETVAEATVVTGEDRVVEIARMLSGETTPTARRHAREVLRDRSARADR